MQSIEAVCKQNSSVLFGAYKMQAAKLTLYSQYNIWQSVSYA